MSLKPTAVATDNVRISVFDLGEEAHRPRTQQAALLRRGALEPARVIEERNTTCVGLDELRVDSLDEAQGAAETAVECAVGTDGATLPAYNDRSLSNEVYRSDIASTEDQGTDLYTSTFLSTNEANGNDLAELGLYSSGDRLLNHSTFTAVTKTSSKAVTLEVTLSFSSA